MYNNNNEILQNKEDVFQNKELLDAIKQLKNGNEQGFATIYHKTYKYVYSRAKCMFSDEETAQDLVQEVYVAVYRNIHSLQRDESLYAWLRTITFQQGTMLMRKDRKELLLSEDNEEKFDFIVDEDVDIENEYADRQDIETIKECINRLSDEHKSIVLAYYYDNLKVEDIGELFGISVGTVKSRLFSARKKLKLYIEEAEKKQGYKLHSFGGIILVLAMKSLLQDNMEVTNGTIKKQFYEILAALGIKVGSFENAITPEKTKMFSRNKFKELLEKILVNTKTKIVAFAIVVAGIVGMVVTAGVIQAPNNQSYNGNQQSNDLNQDTVNESNKENSEEVVVNLNNYISVGYRGMDGEGCIDYEYVGIDKTKLITVLHQHTIGLYNEDSLEDTLENDDNHNIRWFNVIPNKSEGLANGDKVIFTWSFNERGFRLLQEQVPGVKFVYSDFESTVSGLIEVQEVDPFDIDDNSVIIDYTLTNSRVSGEAILEEWGVLLKNRVEENWSSLDIEVDTMGHTGYWKNGDQVKITITSSDEYILEEFGVILTKKTGVVTVNWLIEEEE